MDPLSRPVDLTLRLDSQSLFDHLLIYLVEVHMDYEVVAVSDKISPAFPHFQNAQGGRDTHSTWRVHDLQHITRHRHILSTFPGEVRHLEFESDHTVITSFITFAILIPSTMSEGLQDMCE